MHPTDQEIVREVLAGEKHRYAEIVTRYQRPVYNLMYRHSRHEHDAADLTQEVFLRAYDRLSTYRPDLSFFSWLYTLAINRANDWSRACRRQQTGMQTFSREEGPGEIGNPVAGTEKQEEERMLQEALDLLAPQTREILLLRYRHEQPVREVAVVFGISESAAKMRVKRGLAELQEIMQEMDGNGTRTP